MFDLDFRPYLKFQIEHLKSNIVKVNMFCPGCGSEQRSQYCRSCGTDLRLVRTALEKQDANLASATSARDEIGRAIADKIRDLKSAKELSKVVEDVLPGVTEFLESPEEKRLRRIRAGMIIASIGLGAALAFAILGIGIGKAGPLFVAGLGLATFLIGLGFVFNGWLFTIPKKGGLDQAPERSVPAATESLPTSTQKDAAQEQLFTTSVTEHTTHQLRDSQSLWKQQ
jgi:hypothetical protein